MTRTEQLRQLMREHQLQAADVARLLERSVQTVNFWRCAGPSAADREIPRETLELLRLKLEALKAEAERSAAVFDDRPADVRRGVLSAQGGEVLG